VWELRPDPFVMQACTKGNIVPLSYWLDEDFPSATYRYDVVSEDSRNDYLDKIDPGRFVLSYPLKSGVQFEERYDSFIRLGGRAIRTIWGKRNLLPEHLWMRNERVLPQTGMRVSEFCIDGLRLLNPHGVLCTFYLVRTRTDKLTEVRWGITPIEYDRGPKFFALTMLDS